MYKCCFPGCKYETDDRSLIEFHHVHLRELFSRVGKDVTIPCCPNHHNMIFHEGATAGQHSRMHPDSMIVKTVTNTTHGMCVIFEDMTGEEHCVDMDSRPSSSIRALKWDILHGITETDAGDIDEAVAQRVDDDGFFDSGATVYYTEGHEKIAKVLLSKFIENYMTKAKSEFDSALDKARNDWLKLRNKA